MHGSPQLSTPISASGHCRAPLSFASVLLFVGLAGMQIEAAPALLLGQALFRNLLPRQQAHKHVLDPLAPGCRERPGAGLAKHLEMATDIEDFVIANPVFFTIET